FYHRDVFAAIERQLRTYLEDKGEITAGAFRDLMQISRKYAIPLLEHFDNQRLTMRIGDKRVLRRVGWGGEGSQASYGISLTDTSVGLLRLQMIHVPPGARR